MPMQSTCQPTRVFERDREGRAKPTVYAVARGILASQVCQDPNRNVLKQTRLTWLAGDKIGACLTCDSMKFDCTNEALARNRFGDLVQASRGLIIYFATLPPTPSRAPGERSSAPFYRCSSPWVRV